MADGLIQEWNSTPPPTAKFLEELARWREVSTGVAADAMKARDALIGAIATPQDLAQFLFERGKQLRCELIENKTVDSYWDALAGVLVEDADRPASNLWSGLARMLDKALYYE